MKGSEIIMIDFDVISLDCAMSTISTMYKNFSFKFKTCLNEMKQTISGQY